MSQYWFRPKRHGIGIGVPLNWKGWALVGAYIAVMLALPSLYEPYFGYPDTLPVRIFGVIAVSIPFFYVAEKKTEGGWRWRRGGEDTGDGSES